MAPAARAMKNALSAGSIRTRANPTRAPAGSARAESTAMANSIVRRRVAMAGTAIANSSGMLCKAIASDTTTPPRR
jgi:hypothetical protein